MTKSEFAASFSAHFPMTMRFIASKGVTLAEAEEIAQAAWARGWERRQQLKEKAKVLNWVNTIAFNLLRNSRRKESLTAELVEAADPRQRVASVSAKVDAEKLLSHCDAKNQSLIQMHYGEGFSAAEAGQLYGLTASATRVRLMRVRNRLRRRFSAPGRQEARVAEAAAASVELIATRPDSLPSEKAA